MRSGGYWLLILTRTNILQLSRASRPRPIAITIVHTPAVACDSLSIVGENVKIRFTCVPGCVFHALRVAEIIPSFMFIQIPDSRWHGRRGGRRLW